MAEITDGQLQKIALAVEKEFGMGGLSSGLYFDFAAAVARRAVNVKTSQCYYDDVGEAIMRALP